ncbi:hypothetical protein NMY22_g5750 [Coprinellus aureogranulatus]|nr:hypothetical protein NMY22_g5750 [Coprinellus aureogranulatus]
MLKSSTLRCPARRTRPPSSRSYEGIDIGGDRYPGTAFIDHVLCYETDPDCKMLVLDDVGGIDEYRVIEAVKNDQVKKPIVAWAIGTWAKMFTIEVMFGHAGSMANSDLDTADTGNKAVRDVGFVVPDTFEELRPTRTLSNVHAVLKGSGVSSKPKKEGVWRNRARISLPGPKATQSWQAIIPGISLGFPKQGNCEAYLEIKYKLSKAAMEARQLDVSSLLRP